MLNFERKNLLCKLVQLSAFLFGALSLIAPSGYSYGPALLLCASFYFFINKSVFIKLPTEMRLVGLALITYFIVMAISVWIDGGKLSEIDRASRALMIVITLPLLVNVPVRLPILLSGYGVGAISAFLYAVHDKYILGFERAFNNTMPIQSGDIAMSLGLFCLCGLLWAQKKAQPIFSIFMSFGAFCGIGASFLSGSRGGWVLLPVVLYTILMLFKVSITRKNIVFMMMAVLLGTFLVIQPQSGVAQRIESAQLDVTQYLDKTNLNTSLGIRFQLWQSAWASFIDKPLFGWGNHGARLSQAQQLQNGVISQYIYDFNSHAHNQFLDDMAKRGVIGLIALLMILLVPVVMVRKILKRPDNADVHCGAALVIVTAFTSIDYCLSQAYFGHNSGITFYLTSLVIGLSVVFGRKSEDTCH